MNKVLIRSLSGILYVAFIVACILQGELWITLMAILFASVGMLELNQITGGFNKRRIPLLILDVLVVASASGILFFNFIRGGGILMMIFSISLLARIIFTLYIKDNRSSYRLAVSLFGYCYIGLPMMFMTIFGSDYPAWLLLVFILIWLNDTGAFCVGSLTGRHKLFPAVSPNKTWEGFFGGFIFCILTGIIVYYVPALNDFFNFREFDLTVIIPTCGAISVIATYGDLIESLIKRNLGIKDSGHFLPGHGGILDRIDSLLLVMLGIGLFFLTASMMP